MRIAYLDCFSGISGDMFLGALVDAGVPPAIFEEIIASLNIGARLEISRVNRSGISATKVDVIVNEIKDQPREKLVAGSRGHLHFHTYSDDLEADHSKHGHHGRALSQIRQIINDATLSISAKQTAIAIFEKLGAAEAKIHNVPIEQIHFRSGRSRRPSRHCLCSNWCRGPRRRSIYL